ncbi:MAG: hypothetical protein MUC89_03760 [Acetobacteraceae bacterium]|jgi:hypothetical protein|nr:hypothetical protein [Acetobacteraceae bacterium]
MTEAALAEPAGEAVATRGAVTGYVEARTNDRILGWAWDPSDPNARLTVAILAGGRILARTVADQAREDLARNGIGDGAHAFCFTLDDAARAAGAALEVVVLGPDGPIARLPAAGAEAGQAGLAQLQRGLATIAAGQRALLKAVQAPPAPGADLAEMISAMAAQQQRIDQAVGALEIFVTRLDARLASLGSAGESARPAHGPLLLAGALALAGAAAIIWALAPALG